MRAAVFCGAGASAGMTIVAFLKSRAGAPAAAMVSKRMMDFITT
jgi:hypothetical protein